MSDHSLFPTQDRTALGIKEALRVLDGGPLPGLSSDVVRRLIKVRPGGASKRAKHRREPRIISVPSGRVGVTRRELHKAPAAFPTAAEFARKDMN